MADPPAVGESDSAASAASSSPAGSSSSLASSPFHFSVNLHSCAAIATTSKSPPPAGSHGSKVTGTVLPTFQVAHKMS